MFYYTLGNLASSFEVYSKVHSAFSLGRNIKQYSFEKVLEPFINHLNKAVYVFSLQTAVEWLHSDTMGTIRVADTLAAHQVGGFKMGVGWSFRKCRDCLATREEEDVQNKVRDCVYEYITPNFSFSKEKRSSKLRHTEQRHTEQRPLAELRFE